jgi:hypothetical protein
MSPNNMEDRGDLFLIKMKKDGIIDQAVFSLYIDLENDRSKITYGGFNLPKYSQKGGNLTYHEINKRSMHW